MQTLISISGLTKVFGKHVAVDNISLDIYDKEFMALLGPSGCGKTTLLRMLGGFETPDSGGIVMDGKDITGLPPNKRALNMVFQSYAVFPHMNAYDNVAYGLRMDRVAASEIETRVKDALLLVRMDGFADRFAHQLSGGQRQRIALARALVKRPQVLLLDEPLSALDAKLREAMQSELCKLQKTVGITFVVVTHDQDEALSMAERVAVMKDGKIMQLDAPRNLYEAPKNRFVADFVGRMNILPARRLRQNCFDAEGVGEIAVSEDNEKAAFAAIRPEKIFIADATTVLPEVNMFAAEVLDICYYGGETVLTIKTEKGATLSISRPNTSRQADSANVGENVKVFWQAENMITLDE
ncbi:MAG: ABC transporter ATP-binding protein [Gammaproteobacteria bacterium WSBS_2016_MAG_OTU1]